ncbi:MAG: hypothetical protein CVU71_03685 [Deltaproteobacteria bacterium HGW-Deltaproteobacteria-6]|jgi:hypothetical protein|nr:MAG: hypothetical protein CVU71_03685 [Deltaproteobacteria bacterium HGW-Deltaproteobacteria-6]
MAIAVTNPDVGPGSQGGAFIINATSADASGCEELKAAPAAGKSIYIKHLTINNGANAISHTVGEGETTGAVTTALIGPIAMAANTSMQWDFYPPMKLTAATALTIDSSGAGAVCVFAEGYVE